MAAYGAYNVQLPELTLPSIVHHFFVFSGMMESAMSFDSSDGANSESVSSDIRQAAGAYVSRSLDVSLNEKRPK